MHFIEETHTEVNLSLEEHYFIAKREVDDFVNRKTGNEVDQDLNQKSTIKRYSDIKSEENFETHIEEILSLKKYPLNAESLTVKKELDDFDNGKTANEVAEDFDHKSITIHSYVKSEEEEENLKNSQYLISHDEINIKSEDVVESSARFAQPNTTVELNKLKLKLKLKMLCDPKKNLPDKVNTTMKRFENDEVGHKPQDQIKIHKCPDCPYKSKIISNFKRHSVRHRKPDEIVWHHCTECRYKTEWKSNLKKHAIGHNETRQFEMFKCAFMAHHEENIPQVHCPDPESPCKPLERQEYVKSSQFKHESTDKLHACPYKTIRQLSLNTHAMQVHGNPEQLEWYMCEKCPYKTSRKYNLRQHALTHNREHVKWLQCMSCSFKTWRESHFRRHQRKHQNDDSPSWFKCSECPYKTIRKDHSLRHAKNHKAADQTDWLQCPECSYRTPRTERLKAHRILHAAAVEWFHCFDCPFKTNWKRSLVSHVKTHRQTSQDRLI